MGSGSVFDGASIPEVGAGGTAIQACCGAGLTVPVGTIHIAGNESTDQ
jgi:hypothetical protein